MASCATRVAQYKSTTATWVMSGEVLVEKQQVSFGLPFIADGRPARVVERRGDGRRTQGSQRGFTQPGPHENAVFMHGEREYASTSRDFALRRHVDAEALGVVNEAGVAGDDVVALDAAEAERVGRCARGLRARQAFHR